MKGNPYLGNLVDRRDTREPQDYIIRKEPEPLLKQGYAYHAYMVDGTPMYIGEPTIEATEARLRRGYPVKSIIVENNAVNREA